MFKTVTLWPCDNLFVYFAMTWKERTKFGWNKTIAQSSHLSELLLCNILNCFLDCFIMLVPAYAGTKLRLHKKHYVSPFVANLLLHLILIE